MTLDEAIKQLEYGIEQMTMELKSGLWETGSDTEAEVKQGVKYNQQLIDWLTELKEAKSIIRVCNRVLGFLLECEIESTSTRHEVETLLKNITKYLSGGSENDHR